MEIKKILIASSVALGAGFAGLSAIALSKKGESVYDDKPEEKNPMEGKRVIFVQDDRDKENADGVKGHLESVGDAVVKDNFYTKYGKRVLDIILSFGGLVVLSPIYLGTAIAIKIDDPGPVFFTQKRMGKNKEFFQIHKFRSMKMATPRDVPTHKLDNPDQYITRVGKFIRAHSIDELPQIWDIFIGNMSVIGPRPALWNQDLLISEREKYGVNEIKPGLTGWAQINGRDEIEIEEKARLDGEYVEKQSLAFDMKCFMGTVSKVAQDDSVVEGGTGKMKKKICTSNKLVSIITPAYNAHGYIEAAIESVIAQTYQNWEMLVANDCSNDDTAQIVEKYASEDSRIKLLNLPQNGGVAKARNYAIERAEGAYIAFLDADDMWLPDKLEKQIEFMEEKNAAFSFTSYEIIDEKGEKTGKYVSSKKTMRANEILRNTLIGCLTVVVNREQVGDFRMPLISHAEDSMAWHEILKRGYVAYGLPEILAQYRVTNSSLTSSKKKVAKLHWKNYRSYCGFGLVKSGLYFTSYAFHAATKAKKNKK